MYAQRHLEVLEAEGIHLIREVAAEFERPALMFSGGKDSAVMLHLAEKAFAPARIPFPVLHVDTGHNFPEVLEFRDERAAELRVRLVVASVQDSIDAGRAVEETGRGASRNRLQTVTLLDAVAEHRFDALFGGGRRDEEKARAKERLLSFRDSFGQWDPKRQRPELWNLYNTRIRAGEHVRAFPISNWTELDVWAYVAREKIPLPSLYFAHDREVFERAGILLPVNPFVHRDPDEVPRIRRVRYRTVGDVTCTGAVPSSASTVGEVISEIAAARVSERGQTRADDRAAEAAMEDRKREGVLLMAATALRPADDGIDQPETQGTLRIATAGSVDDGKSTLIGRLLYDTKTVLADQLAAIDRTSRDRGDEHLDLALLPDGLRAEREQGITIDVAYRYFATARRSFIMADTPGHVQYTRNMVTGAFTADLAIVLVDARHGLTAQSRRHTFLASLLRVPHLLLAVNKMDLVGFSRPVFESVREEFEQFATRLDVPDVTAAPISALHGDNVVEHSPRLDWFAGPTLLHHLETVHVSSDRNLVDVRFPVQYVIRPQSPDHPDYRGYAGRVAGGVLRAGTDVLHLPSGITTRIAAIDGTSGPLTEAYPPSRRWSG